MLEESYGIEHFIVNKTSVPWGNSTKDKVAAGLAIGAAVGSVITTILLLYCEFGRPLTGGNLPANYACTIQLLLHVWMGIVTLAVVALAVYQYPDDWIPSWAKH